jgi:hypothetical protein
MSGDLGLWVCHSYNDCSRVHEINTQLVGPGTIGLSRHVIHMMSVEPILVNIDTLK